MDDEEMKVTFSGKHRAIIHKNLENLMENIDFNPDNGFDKTLLNATAIRASTKIDFLSKKTIETEIDLFNRAFGKKISYDEFIFMDEPYLALYNKYPELSKSIRQLFLDLATNFNLIKSHTIKSEHSLIQNDYVTCLEEITEIFYMNGESHDGNKNIVVFYKNKKPAFCLKLRDISLEEKISSFVNGFLVSFCGISDWHYARYICGDNFGWMQWVKRHEFRTEEEVREYYKRFGLLLALCSSLNITDLHYENVIANLNPVPIDYETAVHCNNISDKVSGVIRTALLPHTLKYSLGRLSLEHSGIGNIFEESQWDGDVLRGNSVIFEGKVISPVDYIEEISEAFVQGCNRIISNKSVLYEFLGSIKNLNNRVILKPTSTYFSILDASTHPSLMRSSEERMNYVLNCLKNSREHYHDDNILYEEARNIIRGDVPRFTNGISNCIIYSDNSPVSKIPKNIVPGYTFTKQYISSLNEKMVACELNDLKGILTSCKKLSHIGTRDLKDNNINKITSNLECEIRQSVDIFISSDEYVKEFIAFYDNSLEYREAPMDLFNGFSGIFYVINNKNIFNDTIVKIFQKKIISYLSSRASSGQYSPGGAYIGDFSCMFPLVANYACLSHDDKKYISDKVQSHTNLCMENMEDFPGGCSMVGGVSGLMILSSLYYLVTKESYWKKLSEKAFSLLLSQSLEDRGVLHFPYPRLSVNSTKCLSGLSHGQAGIAYAFALYGVIFPEKYIECMKITSKTISFEIVNYRDDLHNWVDLRRNVFNSEALHDFSWAHGGAGIIYAINFILKHYDISHLNKFYQTLDLTNIFNKQLTQRSSIKNYTISNGHLGGALIYKRLTGKLLFSVQDIIHEKDYKFSSSTGFGLLKGLAGEYLAIKELTSTTPDIIYPLLPHELFTEFRHHLEVQK